MRRLYVLVTGTVTGAFTIASCASITGLDGLAVDACFDGCDGSDAFLVDAAMSDSGSDATRDGGNSDAATADANLPIPCGSAACSGVDVCCVRPGGQPAPTCASACNPVKDDEIACATLSNCPGEVCCATTDGNGITKAECAATCSSGVTLCNPALTAQCPAATPNCVAASIAGYSRCAP